MTIEGTTNSGVSDNFGDDNGITAFLSTLLPPGEGGDDASNKKKPSKNGVTKEDESQHQEAEAAEETSEETPEGDAEAEGDKDGGEQAAEKKYVDDDESFVKIKVGDEELEVPVKDLKRLHGQEAALTRKSQEVAAVRKAVEDKQTAYATKLDNMVKRASAKADEFRKLNFFTLAKNPNITAEQLDILQDEARKAFEEETYLKGDLKEFVTGVQKEQQETLKTRASEAVKTLSDTTSPYHIEGWSQKSYNELLKFGIDHGISAEVVNGIVDAPIFKMLHMAMLYKKGSSAVTKPVDKTAKRIVKTTRTAVQKPQVAVKKTEALKEQRKHGNLDNTANAFLAGFGVQDAD